MLVDTHAHVNFNAFREDADEILRRALENDIWVVMPGSQYSTSKRAVEIAERYDRGVYAAVGLHPIHLGEKRKVDVLEVQSEDVQKQRWMTFETSEEAFDYEAYKVLDQSPKVVAIGEFGLDYYYRPKTKAKLEQFKEKQKEVFLKQLELAEELGLPLILHCRVAHEDMLDILGEFLSNPRPPSDTTLRSVVSMERRERKPMRGVVHCFTGTIEHAQRFMALGLYLGFNGLIFKEVPALPNPKEVIDSIPLERIILETDSPYLVPPMAPRERNEPLFITYIAKEIARIKQISLEEVTETTTKNAKDLFRL